MLECIPVSSVHGLTADTHSDVVMYCFVSRAVFMLFCLTGSDLEMMKVRRN